MRSIWLLLLALLVGLGLEALSSGGEFRGDRFDRYRGRWPVIGIFSVSVVAVTGVVHVLRLAAREGHLSEVGRSVAIAGFAAAVVIGTVVLRHRGSLRSFLPVVVAAVAAAQRTQCASCALAPRRSRSWREANQKLILSSLGVHAARRAHQHSRPGRLHRQRTPVARRALGRCANIPRDTHTPPHARNRLS